MLTNDETILICAVRYTLGRISYMVNIVCEYVETKRAELSDQCINIIIRDIEDEIAMCHRVGRTCGMACDERKWEVLLEVLGEKRERRKEA